VPPPNLGGHRYPRKSYLKLLNYYILSLVENGADDEIGASESLPTSPASEWLEDLATFSHRVFAALLRIVAACVFAMADRGFNWVLDRVFSSAPRLYLTLLETVGLVAFGLLYLYLLWDMLCVFVPRLRGKLYDRQNP